MCIWGECVWLCVSQFKPRCEKLATTLQHAYSYVIQTISAGGSGDCQDKRAGEWGMQQGRHLVDNCSKKTKQSNLSKPWVRSFTNYFDIQGQQRISMNQCERSCSSLCRSTNPSRSVCQSGLIMLTVTHWTNKETPAYTEPFT